MYTPFFKPRWINPNVEVLEGLYEAISNALLAAGGPSEITAYAKLALRRKFSTVNLELQGTEDR